MIRPLRLATALLVAAATAASALVAATPSGAATPSAPASVTAAPKYGGIQVSWSKVPGRSVTYTVSSTPAGKGCVTTAKSCFISVTDSTPWQFSVTATSTAGTSSPSAQTSHYRHRVVLVLAGQSNATGWQSFSPDPVTDVNYLSAPYANGADSQDLITWAPWDVRKSGSSFPVALDTLQNRSTAKKPEGIFGPEIGLARKLWADQGLPATVIKAAYPGSWMGSWDPSTPTLGIPAGTGLFPGMVMLVTKTMRADASRGQLDTIGAFYWYQGESDSVGLNSAGAYQANLTNLISAVRSALPLDASAPVALAEEDMAPSWNAERSTLTDQQYATYMQGNADVRAADVAVASTVPHVVVIDTAGLARVAPNYVHLSNVAELSLGQALASATEHLFP